MNRVPMSEALKLMHPDVHYRIREAIIRYDAKGVIIFENQNFSSHEFGRRTAVIYGPKCTYKTPEDAEGQWLNDLPSQRQYPRCYAAIDGPGLPPGENNIVVANTRRTQ